MFKECTVCKTTWDDRSSFLSDPAIQLAGYQVDFREYVAGIFLFNHSCRTTLGIEAKEFEDLYDGPIFEVQLRGGEDCPGFCLMEEELDPCPQECECAFVREILQIVKSWKKREAVAEGKVSCLDERE